MQCASGHCHEVETSQLLFCLRHLGLPTQQSVSKSSSSFQAPRSVPNLPMRCRAQGGTLTHETKQWCSMRVVSCDILILGYEESASLGALTEIMKHNTLLRPIRYSQPRYASGELRQFHDGVDMEPYTSQLYNLLDVENAATCVEGVGPLGPVGPTKNRTRWRISTTYTHIYAPLRPSAHYTHCSLGIGTLFLTKAICACFPSELRFPELQRHHACVFIAPAPFV